MKNLIERIDEIINERCINKGTYLMCYNNYYWVKQEENELPVNGFKRVYNKEYKNEVNKIFDEIHPY